MCRLLLAIGVLSLVACDRVYWTETYRYDEQQPFDTYLLYELLGARPEGLTLLSDTVAFSQLDTLSVTGTNYLFVGSKPYYGEQAVTTLLDYVERGNTAFIAADEVPEDLAYHLFGDDCYYQDDLGAAYYYAARFPTTAYDTATLYHYLSGDSFQLVNIRYWEPMAVNLHTVSDDLLCDPELDNEVLGALDTSGTNFVRFGWGKGDFYFHSNPVFFTNWFLLDSTAYRYPQTVLSAIGEGPIYWDEYHRRYRTPAAGNPDAAQRNYTGGRNLLSGNETLRYIQERRELAFAWYALLIGALLFVISRGRRRQRIIPVVPTRENASRRFIDTISRLVQQKGNHTALAERELQSLRFYLNTHRSIGWRQGEPPPGDLAQRLGLDSVVVERALLQITTVRNGKKLGEKELLHFYRAIEPLYI